MKISLMNTKSEVQNALDRLSTGFLPLLRGNAQQKFDQLAVEDFGIPEFTLMENAGRSAALIIEHEYGPMQGQKVVLRCGSGNNGGDGYVVARTLYNRGASVSVNFLNPPGSPAAEKNFLLLQRLETLDNSGRLQLQQGGLSKLSKSDVYVDALFGVGLNRPIQGKIAGMVDALNSAKQPVIALDLPSGIDADTGNPLGPTVCADLTITFSAYKPGLLLGQGPVFSGRTELVPIGIPLPAVLHKSELSLDWISTDGAISSMLPERDLQAHKYSAGMALIIGGSLGFSGAPVMAARAAARAGAGYVACAVPECIHHIVATAMTEIPAICLAESVDGGINTNTAMQTLEPWLNKANALIIGPGLGKYPRTLRFIESILQTFSIPTVVDADALPVAAQILNNTPNQQKPWILTPHAGEFERMTGHSEISDRLGASHHWSNTWNCTLVLKGSPTIICHPHREATVCGRGNSALATAGSGDVLAGLCGGLLAQGCATTEAATCASHIGGFVADQYARNYHPSTMIAGDMMDGIITAMTSLEKRKALNDTSRRNHSESNPQVNTARQP